jgi:hypothetical protein
MVIFQVKKIIPELYKINKCKRYFYPLLKNHTINIYGEEETKLKAFLILERQRRKQ